MQSNLPLSIDFVFKFFSWNESKDTTLIPFETSAKRVKVLTFWKLLFTIINISKPQFQTTLHLSTFLFLIIIVKAQSYLFINYCVEKNSAFTKKIVKNLLQRLNALLNNNTYMKDTL